MARDSLARNIAECGLTEQATVHSMVSCSVSLDIERTVTFILTHRSLFSYSQTPTQQLIARLNELVPSSYGVFC